MFSESVNENTRLKKDEYLSILLPVCLSVRLSVCLPVCLSVCLSIYLYLTLCLQNPWTLAVSGTQLL